MSNPIRGNRGVTFLETAVVVAIMGLIATISLPGIISSISHYRLNTASRCLVSDLRLARHLALKENRAVRINFLSQRSYQIEKYISGNWTPARDPIQFSQDHGRWGVIVQQVPDPIEFDYMGRVSSPTSFSLLGKSGESRTIEVQSTGRTIEY
ncbi:MAG: GspH/FimT family pseudopilin [Candidatus Glassbacteria bacterium]